MSLQESYTAFARKRPILILLFFMVVFPYTLSFLMYGMDSTTNIIITGGVLVIQYLAVLHLGYIVFRKSLLFYLFSLPLFVMCLGIFLSSFHWEYADELMATGSVGTIVGIILNQIKFGTSKQ